MFQKAETLKEAVWYDLLINLVGWCSNLFVMVSMLLVCVIAVRRAVALYLPFKYNSYFKWVPLIKPNMLFKKSLKAFYLIGQNKISLTIKYTYI